MEATFGVSLSVDRLDGGNSGNFPRLPQHRAMRQIQRIPP